MKKVVAIIMMAAMLLGLCGCAAESESYTVGICQLVQHPALDAIMIIATTFFIFLFLLKIKIIYKGLHEVFRAALW